MNRRSLIKHLGLGGLAGLLPLSPLRLWGAQSSAFTGYFYINLQADGGWDVTSFCDPKKNLPDEKVINNWALTNDIQTAGRLSYAPVGKNADFFNRHYDKILVINGINSRTNAHSVGRLYNFTGSQKNGMPHLSALYGFAKGQGLAMPLMISGNTITAGILAPTSIGSSTFQLINPNLWRANGDNSVYLHNEDLGLINQLLDKQSQTLKGNTLALPKQKQQIQDYQDALFADTRGFSDFSVKYSALTEGTHSKDRHTDALKFALTAFACGLGIAADVNIGGFDTHADHDIKGAASLDTLTNAASVIWDFADQLGISDRLIVTIGSDFSRTPFYNDGQGKDHWPYTSQVVMQKGARWSNRQVGLTDGVHKGQKINPSSLAADSAGSEIEPQHVHLALRDLLGITGTAADAAYPLTSQTRFNFFTA
jgi:hypothetical protein